MITPELPAETRDAVLTVAHRMHLPQLFPLIASLRATGYSGRIIVFASFLSRSTQQGLKRFGCHIIPFFFLGRHVRQPIAQIWFLWRTVFRLPLPPLLKDTIAHRVFHLFYLRHLLYLRFLERNPSLERIVMCDARDVYFQRNPFSCWPGSGLHAFAEDSSIRIGDCPHHKRWIKTLSNETTFRELTDLPRVCAGTILADRTSAISFLKKMLDLTFSARSLEAHDGDQGLYNILVHQNLVDGITVHSNGTSSVFTIGGIARERICTDAEGFVLGKDQSRVPILHQYDRKPEIASVLLAKLSRSACE